MDSATDGHPARRQYLRAGYDITAFHFTRSDSVWSLYRRVGDAAYAWQFVMARMLAGELWNAMEAVYPYMSRSYEPTDVADDWADLRPLFE